MTHSGVFLIPMGTGLKKHQAPLLAFQNNIEVQVGGGGPRIPPLGATALNEGTKRHGPFVALTQLPQTQSKARAGKLQLAKEGSGVLHHQIPLDWAGWLFQSRKAVPKPLFFMLKAFRQNHIF